METNTESAKRRRQETCPKLKKDERRIDEMRRNFNKQLENTKKNQSEFQATITEVKNTLQRINYRLDEAENHISDLEDKLAENTQSEQLREKRTLKRIVYGTCETVLRVPTFTSQVSQKKKIERD